jgi:hypothetical protein
MKPMKFRHLRGLIAAWLLILACVLAVLMPDRAEAGAAYMCQGDVSGASTGARTIGGTNSAVPSQTLYSLNSNGCALIQLADIGYFQSQGYVQNSSQTAIIFNTGVATGTTDFVIGTLPAKTYIQQIIFSNSVAAAVTGGISIGTTANGTNIVAAQAVGASTDVAVAQASILLPVPLTTGLSTPLHAAAVTAWNSANVTITVIYASY